MPEGGGQGECWRMKLDKKPGQIMQSFWSVARSFTLRNTFFFCFLGWGFGNDTWVICQGCEIRDTSPGPLASLAGREVDAFF